MGDKLRLLRVVFALLIGSTVMSGCGGVAQTESKSAAAVEEVKYVEPQVYAKGWTLRTLEDDHVALSLPPGWLDFNLSKESLQTIIGEMMDANPTFGGSMSGQITSMVSQGVKMYAFDRNSISIASGFVENVNLVRTEKPSGLTLDAVSKASMKELKEQMGSVLDGPVMSARLTTTTGHDLARLNYDAVFNIPGGGAITLSIVQYIGMSDSNMYVLTGTAPISRFDDYDNLFEGIAQSIYFLP